MTQSFEYGKSVMKRFLKPKFAGELKNASGIGQVGNAACGDIMRVFIKVDKDKKGQEKIKDIRFKTMGCVAAIASSDAVCEIAKGKTIEDAKKINKKNILQRVGKLPQVKHHCSILGEEALLAAIKDYEKKKQL
jgi:nitrogen fixation NifU-like protein